MDCINKCGTKYLRELHREYDDRLKRFIKDFEAIKWNSYLNIKNGK